MKKRRIISLLLTASLIISSLSVTAFAQNSADVQTDSPQFVDGNGQAVTVVQPADTEPYIHVSGRDSGQDSVRYIDTVTPYSTSKTYTISFKIRTPDYVESTDSTIASYPAYNRVLANAMWGGNITLDSGLKMTSDWVAKSYDVTNFNGTLYIFGDWHGNGVVPFDIKDFTIVEKGMTTNLAVNPGALFADGAGWEVYNAAEANNMKEFTVSLAADSEYMTVPSIANVAAVKYDSDDVLSAGVYQISGDFRLPKIDYNLYTYDASVNLSSDGNAVPLTLTVGETTATPIGDVTITPDNWTNASFQLLLTENVSKSDIVFSLNTKYGLDFRNIEIEDQTENYDLTFLTADGQLVSPPQADEDTYIRFTGRDSADDVLLYKDTTRTYDESKTYTVSFKIRSREYIESTDAAIGEYPAYVRLIANSRWGTQIDGSIKLTSGWVQKTYDITGFNGELYFASHWIGLSMLPYDIKDLTITEKGTSENLAANADKIYRDGAGWEIYSNPGEGIKELGVYTMPRTDYLVVPSPTNPGDTTAFSFTNTDTLEPGVYHITGSFMLTDSVIDFNKYVFSGSNLSEDRNFKDLTVSVNANALKTLNGEESVKVNSESFTNVTYRLTVSADDNISMSDILFTLSDSHDLCIKDISVTESSRFYTFGFVDGEGNPPMIVDGSQDELYLSVDGRAANADSLYYEMAGLDAGTYTASFKIRTKPYIAATDETVGTYPASIRCNFNLNSGSQTTIASYYPISSAWENKSITFTVTEDNSSICLTFTGVWQGFGYAPFDIKDFAIVKSGSDENIAVNANGFLENGCGWNISESSSGATKELTLTRSTDIYYNRVALPESGNTELHFTGDDVLEPGTYEITGTFRLENDAPIDFSKYVSDGDSLSSDGNIISSEICAYAGSVKLSASTGNKVTVNSDGWRNVTFNLETIVPIDLDTLYFTLDGAYALDFKEINVSLLEKHLTLTPFGVNIITVLLAVKAKRIEELGLNAPWGASSGNTITTVDNVLDDTTGLIGKKDGPAANNYIHMSGRDHNSDRLVYENKTATLAPGTYTLTFWARTSDFINTDSFIVNGRNPVSVIRLFITSSWDIITNYTVRSSGSFDPAQSNQLMLTNNWSKYSFTFTLDEEKPFYFWFGGNSTGNSMAPIDIDGFNLVKVNPQNYRPITGENLALNGDKLMGTKAGWYVSDSGATNLSTEVNNISESEYMRVTANGDGIITLANKGAKLAPGKYYITVKSRIGVIDYLGYVFTETNDSISADNNKATLTASFNGNNLKTVTDADSAEITTEWSTVTFVVDVKEESSLKQIKLNVQGAKYADFDYINIDTRINKTDKDSVTPSADGTVVLPPLEVDMNDNLLTEAISEHNLPYWSYGDQKLTLKEDENGELYFAASGIKDSAEGFIYKPGFIIKPGTYTFKATLRTAVEGERQRYRIMVGDLSTPAIVGDEWTTITTEFTVTDEMEFTLMFRGGSSKLNILDYEFKDISFTNVIVEYLGKDVFENGDFNDSDAALETWSFGRSSGVLTVVNDGEENFLRVSEKVDSNAAIDAKTGHTAFVGVKYKISFDIRTSKAGETMQARTDAIAGGKTAELNDANGVRFFEVTDQWQHVEHSYTPEAAGDLILRIAGGWRGEPDNKDFDIDNVKIEVVG